MEPLNKLSKQLLLFTFITAISSGLAVRTRAQTFSEWFAQNKTQKKYLLQQVAALKVYAGYVKKGYDIANSGLGTITAPLKAEYWLHDDYYQRLTAADPVIKNHVMTKAIIAWQQGIVKQLNRLHHTQGLRKEEHAYLAQVAAAVLKDCAAQLDRLEKALTSTTTMSLPDRLKSLADVHSAMRDNYVFAAGFTAQARLIAANRSRDLRQVRTEQSLLGTK